LCLILAAARAAAQDLDPRAYAAIPIDTTVLVSGFALSRGGVVSDPTLPVQDLKATVETPIVSAGRTFAFFDRPAQFFFALPYSFAQISANVVGEPREVTRSGLGDLRLRFSTLLRGVPAARLPVLMKAPRRTIIGTSFTLMAPSGQNYPAKLINLGANRWGFKPEIALSQPIRTRWLLDVYTAMIVFTDNHEYFPGTATQHQDPITTLQGHISYNFKPAMWLAFDTTYYFGGQSTIDGVRASNQQSNSRVGATFTLPVGRSHSIKFATSTGAIIRYGADFNTFSVGWQSAIFAK
jgi:hypothetical protein